MKKIYLLLILCVPAILMLSNSCKVEAPEKYKQPDAIYFNLTADSANYLFAQYPTRMVDTIKVPVAVMGNASAKDRVIDIQLADSLSTAVAGVHYKLLRPYILPANQYSTVVPIVVYRTPDMTPGKAFSVKFKLVANSDFSLGITLNTNYKLNISYMQKPADWGTLTGLTNWAGNTKNFGTWTVAKYTMILNALYNPATGASIADFTGNVSQPPPVNAEYLQMVKNYLRLNYPGNFSTPLGVGATLRDPDANNAVILVGPANY